MEEGSSSGTNPEGPRMQWILYTNALFDSILNAALVRKISKRKMHLV